jgi:hypothetical protein
VAITLVRDHGGATATAGGGTTTVVDTLSFGIAVGNTVLVSFNCTDAGATTVTATDSKGNMWSTDTVASNTATGTTTTAIMRSTISVALVATDTITVTINTANKVLTMLVTEWSDLDGPDQVANAGGTTTAFDSGLTPTTTQPDELVCGALGWNRVADSTYTPGTGLTGLTAVTANQGTTRSATSIEYKIVSVTGTYKADGTFGSIQTAGWEVICRTYKQKQVGFVRWIGDME